MDDNKTPLRIPDCYTIMPTATEGAFAIEVCCAGIVGSAIYEGDVLIVEPHAPICNGDVVICFCDKDHCCVGEISMRRSNGGVPEYFLQNINTEVATIHQVNPEVDKIAKVTKLERSLGVREPEVIIRSTG